MQNAELRKTLRVSDCKAPQRKKLIDSDLFLWSRQLINQVRRTSEIMHSTFYIVKRIPSALFHKQLFYPLYLFIASVVFPCTISATALTARVMVSFSVAMSSFENLPRT